MKAMSHDCNDCNATDLYDKGHQHVTANINDLHLTCRILENIKDFNENQRRILKIGPKFIPSTKLNDKTAEELRIALAY